MTYTRLDAQWGSAGEYWHLAGSFERNTDKQFKALSSIAGQKLASVLNPEVEVENELLHEPNPAIRWYKGIWKISNNFEYGFIGEQTNNDGTSGGHIYTGTINKIGEAAATFCLELAARYPESEEGKKLQSLSPEMASNNSSHVTKSGIAEGTRVDIYLQKVKNHPIISLLIVFGIVVISLAKFTDAINKLIESFPFLHQKSAIEDKKTNSQTIGNHPSMQILGEKTSVDSAMRRSEIAFKYNAMLENSGMMPIRFEELFVKFGAEGGNSWTLSLQNSFYLKPNEIYPIEYTLPWWRVDEIMKGRTNATYKIHLIARFQDERGKTVERSRWIGSFENSSPSPVINGENIFN